MICFLHVKLQMPVKQSQFHSKQEVSASESEADDKETDRPASPEDVREDIKSKFLVAMPEDFYEFWEFAKSVDPTNPSGNFV